MPVTPSPQGAEDPLPLQLQGEEKLKALTGRLHPFRGSLLPVPLISLEKAQENLLRCLQLGALLIRLRGPDRLDPVTPLAEDGPLLRLQVFTLLLEDVGPFITTLRRTI